MRTCILFCLCRTYCHWPSTNFIWHFLPPARTQLPPCFRSQPRLVTPLSTEGRKSNPWSLPSRHWGASACVWPPAALETGRSSACLRTLAGDSFYFTYTPVGGGNGSTPPLMRLAEVVLNIDVQIQEPPALRRNRGLFSGGDASPTVCVSRLPEVTPWGQEVGLLDPLSPSSSFLPLQNPKTPSQSGHA